VADVSNLVGYEATLLGNWFPTFRDKVFILSLGVYMNKKEILRKFSFLTDFFLFRIFLPSEMKPLRCLDGLIIQ